LLASIKRVFIPLLQLVSPANRFCATFCITDFEQG
jgi:hypothetical protein